MIQFIKTNIIASNGIKMEEELMEILERRRSLLAVEGMKDDEREK
jgi:hypothetical protein